MKSRSLTPRFHDVLVLCYHVLVISNNSKLLPAGRQSQRCWGRARQVKPPWREGFIRTFLERDLPQLGISIPATAMRRFWTMLAHYHAQTWNASEISRAMGLSDKTVRAYLDILSGAFMVRQLQPWFENTAKRQVRAPKIYLRDSGLLHSLLDIPDQQALFGHPKVGASWEGFAIEQALQLLRPSQAYYWAKYGGAELDLLFFQHGKRYGIEVKFSEAPQITRSMYTAVSELQLAHLWVVYPGQENYPAHEKITVCPLKDLEKLITCADNLSFR